MNPNHLRFDSQERLKRWRERGEFPQIHDNLFQLVRELAEGRRFCDLCCSTGLLGERLRQAYARRHGHVVGVDCDEEALQAGSRAGLTYKRLCLAIAPATLPTLVAWLQRERVNVLVARRCLSEIFRDRLGFGPHFARAMAVQVGVREIFLQGRQQNNRATHPIPNAAAEAALLTAAYDVVERRGECIYLTVKETLT